VEPERTCAHWLEISDAQREVQHISVRFAALDAANSMFATQHPSRIFATRPLHFALSP
jgi:hypothetical protein